MKSRLYTYISVCVCVTIICTRLFPQGQIQVNLTTDSSQVIAPFSGVGTIYGLTFNGSITLTSDTSYARIILVDADTVEYLVYEAYPLLVDSLGTLNLTQQGIETWYLPILTPVSLKLQLGGVSLTISQLNYKTSGENGQDSLISARHDSIIQANIQQINERCEDLGLLWRAGMNPLAGMTFSQKSSMSGGYVFPFIHGFEYYLFGVYEGPPYHMVSTGDGGLVKNFDWRCRHGSNQDIGGDFPYYNHELFGWINPRPMDLQGKNYGQGICKDCASWAMKFLAEAYFNVYLCNPVNLQLCLLQIRNCAWHDCTYYLGIFDPPTPCNSGAIFIEEEIGQDFIETGVYDESCLPYIGNHNYVPCPPSGQFVTSKNKIRLNGSLIQTQGWLTSPQIKEILINKGPLYCGIYGMGHSMLLVGYDVLEQGDTIRFGTDPTNPDQYEVLSANSPYMGGTSWILKQTYNDYGPQGNVGSHWPFFYIFDGPVFRLMGISYYEGEIENLIEIPGSLPDDRMCYDWDEDGYCWWGIGDKPENICPSCPDERDCDDSNPNLGPYDPDTYECTRICEFSENEKYIQNDEVWTDVKFFNRNIVVEEYATLTIQDTVYFSEGARIIVKRGAKLLLDGGTLTSGCSGMWKGIEVWGQADSLQDTIDQGYIKIINGGTIENAETGILAGRTVILDSTEVPNLNYTGGIVYAKEAVFRNNITGVKFLSYSQDNNSYFSECRFVNDVKPLINGEMPSCFIWMGDVTGIDIAGCTFTNETEDNWYGRGIFSSNAYYKVHKYCPVQRDSLACVFTNLEYGIYALGMNSTRYIDINKCDFEDNYRGLFAANIDLAIITENRFIIPESEDEGHYVYGVYLEECNAYHVEADTFYGQDGENPLNVGLYISKWNAPYENLIYNNYFENLQFGIIATGENRDAVTKAGLEIRCNDFNNSVNDIVVQSQTINNQPYITNNTGIALYQGWDNGNDPTAPAGNTFSDGTLIEFNYDNNHGGNDIVYFYHQTGSNLKIEPAPVVGLITKTPVDVDYGNKQTACPSHIEVPGINPIVFRGIFNSAYNEIEIVSDSLDDLVDGGNTLALTFEVATSTPDEAIEIRDALIVESPFLSDTVMSTAIQKEDVLTNAMIRDVLVENPQAAKSQELMEAIDIRSDTMPQFMKDQIMAGANIIGAKEQLESRLASSYQTVLDACAGLLRCFSDNSFPFGSDSIKALYEEINSLWSVYKLLSFFHQSGDSILIFTLLDSIPVKFELTDEEENIHERYEILFDKLSLISSDSIGFRVLDSAAVEDLITISDNFSMLPGMYARNLLVANEVFNYAEPVMIPEVISYQPRLGKPQSNIENNKYIKVFPNPAKGYITIEYNLGKELTTATLIITDLCGALIRKFDIARVRDQLIIPITEMSPSVYVIHLRKGNTLLDSSKFTINK